MLQIYTTIIIIVSFCLLCCIFCIYYLWNLYRKLQKEKHALDKDLLQKQNQIERITHTSQLTKSFQEKLDQGMSMQFESLANKIFESKNKQTQEKLDHLLNPFKEKINQFTNSINEAKKETYSLKNEIKLITTANQEISKQADNLAKALKGESKTQGNWGEMILQKILEESGLRKDQDYTLQANQMSLQNNESRLLKPDVVVHLPEQKHVIIDSKTSLRHYDSYCSSNETQERLGYAKKLSQSFRKHVHDLSKKQYQSTQLNTPDFVLMFIPIEGAYCVGIEHDQSLLQFAWDHQIIIVCPSTLFATLKTIAFIWRQEKQNTNAFEIAKKAGALYDKIAGFTEDMEKIGKQIDTSKHTYEQAIKKLSTGRGNILNQTEKLKILGAQTAKHIHPLNRQQPAINEDE